MVCRNAEGVGFSTKDLSMIRYKAHIVFILCFVALVDFSTVSLRAQFSGGSGRGDAVTTVSSLELSGISTTAMYKGGSGRGDVVSSVGPTTFVDWTDGENNRVVTRARFVQAVADTVFTVDTSSASLGYGIGSLRTINQTVLTTYDVTPANAGMLYAGTIKPSNRLLIKGDFRSISIATATGQTSCVPQSTYPQLLWLDRDRLTVGLTKCYTNKTLTTTYTAGNGSDWYNIRGGGAIKIDGTGTITDLSCPTGLGLVVDLDASNANSYPGTGTTWIDLSGNGNNATLTNGPTYDTTAGGNFVFDGVNDCAYRSLLNNTLTTTLSYNVWVRHTGDFGPNRYVMALGRDVGGSSGGMALIGYGFSTSCSGQVAFEFGSAVGRVCSGVTPSLGTWVNYCTTMDGTNTRFYINGVLQATAAQGAGAVTSNPGFSVGSYLTSATPPTPANYWFRGNIARVSVYNRALTDTEVSNIFNATRTRFGL
jgi:hypothetical protein